MLRLILALCVFYALSLPASAYPQPPIEAYGEVPEIQHVAISDNGEKIAFFLQLNKKLDPVDENPNGHTYSFPRSLVIYDTITGETDTSDKVFGDVTDLDFLGNEHLLIRTKQNLMLTFGRQELNYSNVGHTHILNTESMQMSRLHIDGKPNHFHASQFGRILTPPNEENEILIPGYQSKKWNLYRVNLESGAAKKVRLGKPSTTSWLARSFEDGYFREDYNNGRNIYKIVSETDRRKVDIYELKDVRRPPFSIVGFHPISGLPMGLVNRGFDHLAAVDKDGQIFGPILGQAPHDIERVFLNDSRQIAGVRYSGLTPTYDFFNADLDTDIDKLIDDAKGTAVTIVDHSKDWQKLILKLEGNSTSGTFVLYDRISKTREIFDEFRPNIPRAALGEMVAIEYQARDGLPIEAILTFPPNTDPETATSLKTIVMPHGGPEARDSIGFDWLAQYFANRGYLVLQPNFRGSSGYGNVFVQAGNGEWGGKMQNDLTDGLKTLIKENLADPDRVCIIGASYGGYAALAGGAFTPELYKCVIAIAPVSDLQRMLRTEKRDNGSRHWVIDYWRERMTDGDKSRSAFDAISPAKHAEAYQAPVLLIHGTRDLVVPIDQSEVMQKALKKAGKDVEFVELERATHSIYDTVSRISTLQAASDFVEQHIGD